MWENLQAPFRYEKEKAARISFLAEQDEINKKELETRQASETRQAETTVDIERIKQSKQTEGVEIRLAEEAQRFTREQESARQKIQLEEETTRLTRESEQRLALQAAEAEQEAKLAALQRTQRETIENARLDAEARARQKALQVEQALQELSEETRLAEAKFQATQEQLARDKVQKDQESALQLLVQQHEDLWRQQALDAEVARKERETHSELGLEEAANQVKTALLERQVHIDSLRQEARNLINDRDLSNRLVEVLPELAAQMPEIHELKVLQTGDADGAFDALAAFIAKTLSLAESLGISLPKGKE